MLERIKRMLIKEFIHVFRDPRMKAVVFIMPIVQVLVFGYAVTTDVTHVPIAVYDLDNSIASRELIARFVATEYFDLVTHVSDMDEAQRLVDRSEVKAVLHFKHGFHENLGSGRTADLQLFVDGTDSNTAGIVLDYSAKIVGRYSNDVLVVRLSRLGGGAAVSEPLEMET
ncbi:MAG: ABC transporter permease, partial [Candidatus Hydrogenedentota bacterium]